MEEGKRSGNIDGDRGSDAESAATFGAAPAGRAGASSSEDLDGQDSDDRTLEEAGYGYGV
jgi:hypothetical protein